MKLEINLPASVVRRLAKHNWEMSNGWGARISADLKRGEQTIRGAAQHALEKDGKEDR
jgi:hypothetical protein